MDALHIVKRVAAKLDFVPRSCRISFKYSVPWRWPYPTRQKKKEQTKGKIASDPGNSNIQWNFPPKLFNIACRAAGTAVHVYKIQFFFWTIAIGRSRRERRDAIKRRLWWTVKARTYQPSFAIKISASNVEGALRAFLSPYFPHLSDRFLASAGNNCSCTWFSKESRLLSLAHFHLVRSSEIILLRRLQSIVYATQCLQENIGI